MNIHSRPTVQTHSMTWYITFGTNISGWIVVWLAGGPSMLIFIGPAYLLQAFTTLGMGL